MSEQETVSSTREAALTSLLTHLIDQNGARIIVPTNAPKAGFWFGGGNLVRDPGGVFWLVGRYRNYGDSRTGLGAGERGLECALFRSEDGLTFSKVRRWTKADLSGSSRVLSIEGAALHPRPDGAWELYISTEKERAYPAGYEAYQKPGTGVWEIDRLTGPSPSELGARTQETVLATDLPGYLHVKDPVVFDRDGDTVLMFCTHPVSWASSNTGSAVREASEEDFTVTSWQAVPRGPIWDVAVTRVTDRLLVPRLGVFREAPPLAVYFYDGAECMRPLEENPGALKRPRGFSCEELGGALWGPEGEFGNLRRLSETRPLFVSPHGTGSSRYVSTLVTAEGIYATWQQSQPDGSQPLVLNHLSLADIERLLEAAS